MTIALIGNQNSGKTSLFNALTSSGERVGNWAGVTVGDSRAKDKKTGCEIVDLPGTYSLTPYSPEEKVTTDFVNENPDAFFINVADATELERSLYLTLLLIEKNVDFVLALNMLDLCSKRGINIDEKKLEKHLNRNVVKISVKKKIGINGLINGVLTKSAGKTQLPYYCAAFFSASESKRAKIRYDHIEKIIADCVFKSATKKDATSVIDKIILNKWAAIPVFALVMTGIFTLSVGSVGNAASYLVESVAEFVRNALSSLFESAKVADWLSSLVVDGMISGACAVLAFLPKLIILYFCLSVLNSSGYMARVAFIFDELMKKINLDGKALVPLIIGTGCSVPAAESAKTIKSGGKKTLVLFLVPFVPCSAKLPLIALFADFFFKGRSWAIVTLLYFASIFCIVVSAKFLSLFFKKCDSDGFVFDLPSYKLPSASFVFKDVSKKTLSFIKRAGSVIVLSSVVVWFLSSFGSDFTLVSSVKDSLLYYLGKGLSFVLYPILKTFSPSALCATISGMVAKEQIVSTMSVISRAGGAEGIFLSGEFSFFTPVSALAFVTFNVFCPPCISAIATIRKELKSFKLAVFAFLYQLFFAYLLALVISIVGNLFI